MQGLEIFQHFLVVGQGAVFQGKPHFFGVQPGGVPVCFKVVLIVFSRFVVIEMGREVRITHQAFDLPVVFPQVGVKAVKIKKQHFCAALRGWGAGSRGHFGRR